MQLYYHNRLTVILLNLLWICSPVYGMESKRPSSGTPLKTIISGSTAGAIEVISLGHFLSYVINQKIGNNKKFTLIPRNWKNSQFMSLHPSYIYKGLSVNVGSMAPITALQNSGTEEIKRLLRGANQTPLSNTERLLSAALAGWITGYLIATPTEYLPNYMQQIITKEHRNLSVKEAVKELIHHKGARTFWRGGLATGTRDGGFTVGYKTLPHILIQYMPEKIRNTSAGKLFALLISGLLTAVITQPAHVIARSLQNNPKIPHSIAAILQIIAIHGTIGLWKGGVARGLRVLAAVPTISIVEEQITHLLE